MNDPLTWVVGRGGLLGRNVESGLSPGRNSPGRWHPAESVDWADEERCTAALRDETARFLDEAARTGRGWRLLWCAGAGVVATSPDALARETRVVARVLEDLAARLSGDPGLAAAGTLFFASSAGGVYSASAAPPPFDETSPTAALGTYGREKLAQEALFASVAEESSVDLLIGRLSNLYGPGQRLDKPQGLIAHVGRAALRRDPVSIYVPLDTIRDYLLAEDAACMVAGGLRRLEGGRAARAGAQTVVKIFASEVETTVASVLGAWRRVLRRPPLVALASSAVARLQPRVLSFRSRVWPDLRGSPTPLALGVDAVRRDQLARLLAAGLEPGRGTSE
jgi:UDP-glucose 4-epimerase